MNLELAKEKAETGVTLEDIERFNPDKIDCKEFWSNIESKDNTSICGAPGEKSIDYIKFLNKELMISSGFMNHLPRFFSEPINVVEIGAGYCPTKSILEQSIPENLYYYYPTDIVARCEGVKEIKDGVLPFADNSAHLVICSNVFQHLSHLQRTRYIDEAVRILAVGGRFFLGCSLSKIFASQEKQGLYCKELDRYCSLTGEQFIPMPTSEEIYDMCLRENRFNYIGCSSRWDNYCGFWFQRNGKVKVDE